jgi:uncharacterized membrane protein
MKAKVVVAGHALHPMLIVFPLGLLGTSVVWDILSLTLNRSPWALVAYWTIVAGVVGALVAAVPGFIDWLGIPSGTRARRIGVYHLALNLTVVALFVISLLMRHASPGGYTEAGAGSMVWGWLGVGIALVSSWFGGELVEALGISVNEGANPNAPSSLNVERRRNGRRASRSEIHPHS